MILFLRSRNSSNIVQVDCLTDLGVTKSLGWISKSTPQQTNCKIEQAQSERKKKKKRRQNFVAKCKSPFWRHRHLHSIPFQNRKMFQWIGKSKCNTPEQWPRTGKCRASLTDLALHLGHCFFDQNSRLKRPSMTPTYQSNVSEQSTFEIHSDL